MLKVKLLSITMTQWRKACYSHVMLQWNIKIMSFSRENYSRCWLSFIRSKVKFMKKYKNYCDAKITHPHQRIICSRQRIMDMYYVLRNHKKFLSMGQLYERSYDIQIHDGICMIKDSHHRQIAKVLLPLNHLIPLHIKLLVSF